MSRQKLGIGKKGGAALLSAALAVMMFPAAAIPAFAADNEVVCDISKGSVTIQNDRLSYTDSSGASQTLSLSADTDPIVVTGSTTEHTILVQDYDDATINMTFRDLSIDVSEIDDGVGGYKSMCAVYFGGEDASWNQGRVHLTLEGTNTIKSLDYAGIGVPAGETLTIDGSGSLDVSTEVGNAKYTGAAIGAPAPGSSYAITSSSLDTSFGTIIINDGNINASAVAGAIGGTQDCVSGSIVINGGNIKAVAGEEASAAGIGCGQDSTLNSIIITGGTIEATAGGNGGSGPGIGGGGMHTDSGVIFIMGGDITATGGNYGAGIGAGQTNGLGHGYAQLINISGGTVRAYGGYTAAGIGAGGTYGLSDDVTISGGDITAYGGNGDAAESTHSSGRPAVEDGTQIKINGPGAGIGNGGSQATIINYTSGDNAGTTSASQTAGFGGAAKISGGTVRAYSGTVDSTSQALIESTGYALTTPGAIGNAPYIAELTTDDDPYVEYDKSYTGGVIYEDGTLVSADLAYATISGVTDQTYTGKALTPAPVVAVDDTTLEEGTDYTVDYANNTEVGLASLTVTGIGSFNGSQTAYFLINAAAATPTTNPTPSTTKKASTSVGASKVKKIKVGKKQMTVTVKKVSGATGYQIAYRVKGKGKFKTKTAKANGKLKIKKLKTGKKYEVKVTTLKKVGSTTYKAKTSKVKVSKKIK